MYGSKPRNRLDLYLPKSGGDAPTDGDGDKRPVVVFVTVRGLWRCSQHLYRLQFLSRARQCGEVRVSWADVNSDAWGNVSGRHVDHRLQGMGGATQYVRRFACPHRLAARAERVVPGPSARMAGGFQRGRDDSQLAYMPHHTPSAPWSPTPWL